MTLGMQLNVKVILAKTYKVFQQAALRSATPADSEMTGCTKTVNQGRLTEPWSIIRHPNALAPSGQPQIARLFGSLRNAPFRYKCQVQPIAIRISRCMRQPEEGAKTKIVGHCVWRRAFKI